jgi:glycosyltransferase involved in cell wall biosynthesis
MFDDYFGPGRAGRVERAVMRLLRKPLQSWDASTASRVTHFIADSRLVADRIRRHYGRDSDVINPPVDVKRFHIAEKTEEFYFVQSALTPYKRIDLAVEAFNRLGRPLKIGGMGSEMDRLRDLAGPNVELLGWLDDDTVAWHYAHCRAFIFPGLEDFGITPLEAMASGRPVIAYGEGGVLDSVVPLGGGDPPTGVFFGKQSVEDLCEAVIRFEARSGEFEPEDLRRHACQFDREVFKRRLGDALMEKVPELRIGNVS